MANNKTRLVLMSCCAPCSAGAIKQLVNGEIAGIDDFIVLFFNPNIFPTSEYDKRLAEQIRYCDRLGVKYAIGEYDHNAWRNSVRGMETAPERGVRCSACFKFRFDYAKNGRPNTDITLSRQFLVYHDIKINPKLMMPASPRWGRNTCQ